MLIGAGDFSLTAVLGEAQKNFDEAFDEVEAVVFRRDADEWSLERLSP